MTATANAGSILSPREDHADTMATRQFSVAPHGAPSQRPIPPVHLTARQLEVLALLCEGLPNKLICRRLNISAGTVKAHIGSILRELGVSSRLQAVVWARRCGLPADFGIRDQEQDTATFESHREIAESENSSVFLHRRKFN